MRKFKIILVTIIIFMLTLVFFIYKQNDLTAMNELLPITKIDTDKKVVAIACNVYEGKDEIIKMLRILDKKNIKISFFLGGVWAATNAEVLTELKNSGQDIQNHGYYHKLPTTIDKEKNIKEIKDTESVIYKITGIRTTLFEPPSGDYDENTLNIVNSLNYKMVTWSIDTIDWRQDANKEVILKRVSKKLHPGGIILIHPKSVTADNFEELINYIQSRGYQIKSVNTLINEQ